MKTLRGAWWLIREDLQIELVSYHHTSIYGDCSKGLMTLVLYLRSSMRDRNGSLYVTTYAIC